MVKKIDTSKREREREREGELEKINEVKKNNYDDIHTLAGV
jgi:hypothetical protein